MPKFLLNVSVVFAALGLELASMLKIVHGQSDLSDLIQVLLWHLCASILVAVVLPKFLPGKYRSSCYVAAVFFFIIAFFMPAMGVIGLVLAIIPGLRSAKNDHHLPMQVNQIRSLIDAPLLGNMQAENASAENIGNLLCSQNPEKRIAAVYATLKLDDKSAIPLLRIALRDPVDDIRLLAYALLDRKEQRISERIEHAKQSFEENRETADTLHLYRQIAADYWELAHLGLVEGETLNYVLAKARGYLESGLKLYPGDRGLHLQYAKLLLHLGNLKAAYDEFKISEKLGVGRQKLLLYYAEIDFLNRRYADAKRCMNEVNLSLARPEILASARFWQEKESMHAVC